MAVSDYQVCYCKRCGVQFFWFQAPSIREYYNGLCSGCRSQDFRKNRQVRINAEPTRGQEMTIEELPSNALITLTTELARLFRAAECDPTCHSCEKIISEKSQFILATISEGRDVMLCQKCTIEEYASRKKKTESRPEFVGGCLRINGQIISGVR